MKTFRKYTILLLLTAFIMTSCNKDDETPTVENPPVADAGNDVSATVGEKIELDGSSSTDPDGGTLTYSWVLKSKPEESIGTLEKADQIKAEFTPDVAGTYVIELTVNNSKISAKDEVNVTATSPPFSGCISITETISSPTVWKKVAPAGMVDYCVKSDITVNSTLTIEPGVIIEFDDQKGLHIQGGKIIAKGTDPGRIIFTGKNKVKGAWRGIELSSSEEDDNEMDYCEISYAGSSNHISGVKAGLSLRNSSTIKLTNSILNENNGYGAHIIYGSFTSFAKNTFSNNKEAALAIKANEMGKMDKESKFTGGNGRDGIEVDGGTISEDEEQIWPAFADGSQFYILENFTINSGVKVQEGAIIEFAYDKGIFISGNTAYLNAVGTENQKIVFTGIDKTRGAWRGIEFSSSDNERNELIYCEINFAGSSNHVSGYKAGVSARNSSTLKVNNSTVDNSNGFGIAMIYGDFQEFSNNTLSNNKNAAMYISADLMSKIDGGSNYNNENGLNGVLVYSGIVDHNTEVTWPAFSDGSKYYIDTDIYVRSGINIEEGAEFLFYSDKSIHVQDGGYLFARGTAEKKIIFTGDQQNKGHWKGIEFSGTQSSKNELSYCEVSYAGSSNHISGFKGNISLRNNAEVAIYNSLITESAGYGIIRTYGTLIVDDTMPNILSNNTLGDYKD